MAKKYYAVHVGLVKGVYTTWDECEVQVKGVPGAKYKSFPTLEEAEYFVETGCDKKGASQGATSKTSSSRVASSSSEKTSTRGTRGKEAPIRQDRCELFAYIDGSFDSRTGTVGYGGVIIHGEKELEFARGTREKRYSQYWNISGELLAAIHVVQYALSLGVKSCALYYDCAGIAEWGKGAWKTNNDLTRDYASFMKKANETLHIEYYKIAAHTGVVYNERADRLAKKGIEKYNIGE